MNLSRGFFIQDLSWGLGQLFDDPISQRHSTDFVKYSCIPRTLVKTWMNGCQWCLCTSRISATLNFLHILLRRLMYDHELSVAHSFQALKYWTSYHIASQVYRCLYQPQSSCLFDRCVLASGKTFITFRAHVQHYLFLWWNSSLLEDGIIQGHQHVNTCHCSSTYHVLLPTALFWNAIGHCWFFSKHTPPE